MKKLTILFAALTLSAGLWAETVEYRYPVYNDNDAAKGIKEWQTGSVDATEITNASATLAAGWYVVKGTDVQTGTLTYQGAVHIILADGAKLTATGPSTHAGIQVSDGASLTIYAQSTDPVVMGQLEATGGTFAAGIGGGNGGSGSNITINGGTVTATGGGDAAGIGGGKDGSGSNITINGGVVTAQGENRGAGIGGGNGGSGSNITINGGKVIATGGSYSIPGTGSSGSLGSLVQGAAGIGGGDEGFDITINGGEVTATGGLNSAGIGGGPLRKGFDITINGGKVTATGGDNGAGIGGGDEGDGDGSNITITGGEVTAIGGVNAAGIGGGYNHKGSYITINGGTVTATGGDNGAGIGGGGGEYGSGSNIFVDTKCIVKAGSAANPTTEIATTRTATTDIASSLAGKRYATVAPDPLAELKADAVAEIQTAGQGIQNAEMNNWINGAITDINAAGTNTKEKVDNIKNQILSIIQLFQDGETEGYDTGYTAGDAAGYARGLEEGKAAGKAELLGAMGTPCTDCTAVEVTDGTTTVTLYNATGVDYIKVSNEE